MSNIQDEKISVRIGVATTQACRMPEDGMYFPILCGAANRVDDDPLLASYVRDDSGEDVNISSSNSRYCELTGLYWMWKHLDADYYGIVHYRRYMGTRSCNRFNRDPYKRIVGSSEMGALIIKYQVIVPQKRHYYIESLFSHYQHTHYAEHLYLARAAILRKCPEYLSVYDVVLQKKSGYMFNMVVMHRDLMDRYCNWLFPILADVDAHMDADKMSSFDARFLGRVAEIIFNVWLQYQIDAGIISYSDIYELPLVYTESVHWGSKAYRFLQAKYFNKKYSRSNL